MNLKSPAKINLFLRVFSRRTDGYHDLETLFERVDLCDDVVLSLRDRGIVCRTDCPELPQDERNIAVRAANLLRTTCRVDKGASIKIRKRIPIAAGLGGGSSNAATVLAGLNRLWRLNLSEKRLLDLGARLGSDVPFFLTNTSFAVATGRGEKLRSLDGVNLKIWHVIVKPPFGISTKQAYESLTAAHCFKGKPHSLTPLAANARMLLQSIRQSDEERLAGLLENSLELARNKELIKIRKIKKLILENGALGSLMSGSGSAVFGLFKSKALAESAARSLRRDRTLKVYVASTF